MYFSVGGGVEGFIQRQVGIQRADAPVEIFAFFQLVSLLKTADRGLNLILTVEKCKSLRLNQVDPPLPQKNGAFFNDVGGVRLVPNVF